MGQCEYDDVTVVSDGSGDATKYTRTVNGKIVSITYTKTDYADTVDFTLTTETTEQDVWVQDNVTANAAVAPRIPTHSTAGVASLYDTVSNEPVEDHIRACSERIKIVIANAGATKTGVFRVIWER